MSDKMDNQFDELLRSIDLARYALLSEKLLILQTRKHEFEKVFGRGEITANQKGIIDTLTKQEAEIELSMRDLKIRLGVKG